ncbi:ATP-binding protein [Mucilaginibacter aquaedulcis]|uniref:ATP-binding protein n=1 Tax=Mucilaginibacter aquaedulcis TaxID=1187081 RepID=UPI0025B5FAC3|nr:ATP-binding protein [Mucilaginibacter aquaedulcis]MDN3550196.1 ATP-binding protein [Mucilaginibacter aquaedulcis]
MEALHDPAAQVAALTAEVKRPQYPEYKAKILSEDRQYQESQVRFRTLFEASRLGNKIISCELKILQANPAMVELLGYENKEEIIGTAIFDYVPKDCHKDWRFLQEKLWQRSTPSFSLETCLQRRDGSKIWCQVTSILFPDQGGTLGYTIIEDITEKYNLRIQKEEFISVASHELKTPITSLQATLQVVSRMIAGSGEITDNLKKLMASAERHTTKLNHLVGDLLNSTKIDNGQLTLNTTLFTLADVIDGCCSHIQLEGKYHIKYEGNHSPKVVADQHKIGQVLINFVNNAVKYAPESNELVVRVEKLEHCTKVAVIDKGQGIPPESAAKIFERYYRVEEYKQRASGLGLGLYICANIIRQHGGEIGVETEPGKGSAFWFTIPDNAKMVYHVQEKN